MILSDRDIKKAIISKRIIVKPLPDFETQLGSCSLDLTLGDKFIKPNGQTGVQVVNKTVTLAPGMFLLSVTSEYIELPSNICGMLHGRSSLGRKGLMIHSTAPLVDAGFRGNIVLELYNSGPEPIILKVGERVCAVSFEKLSSPASVPYYKKKSAKFVGQKKP